MTTDMAQKVALRLVSLKVAKLQQLVVSQNIL